MANKTIHMSKVRQILRLFVQGKSKKQISELTASSRNTIRKYLYKFIQERITYEEAEQMSDQQLDQLFGYIVDFSLKRISFFRSKRTTLSCRFSERHLQVVLAC
jgi:hypothetical protein